MWRLIAMSGLLLIFFIILVFVIIAELRESAYYEKHHDLRPHKFIWAVEKKSDTLFSLLIILEMMGYFLLASCIAACILYVLASFCG